MLETKQRQYEIRKGNGSSIQMVQLQQINLFPFATVYYPVTDHIPLLCVGIRPRYGACRIPCMLPEHAIGFQCHRGGTADD